MFYSKISILTSLTAICAVLSNAQKYPIGDAVFNPPELKHLIHVDTLSDYSVNATTIHGNAGQVQNLGGNVTGAIEGTIVPLGASYELLAPDRGDFSFYENRFTINTTTTTLVLNIRATIQYANNALHAFGSAAFDTDGSDDNEYAYLNFGSFVAEVSGDFGTGEAGFDVFEVKTGGRIDGEPIKALLPPGEA